MTSIVSHFPDIAQASVQQKLEMIDELWELARRSGDIPLNDLHVPVLQQRVDTVLANPSIALSPNDARALLRK